MSRNSPGGTEGRYERKDLVQVDCTCTVQESDRTSSAYITKKIASCTYFLMQFSVEKWDFEGSRKHKVWQISLQQRPRRPREGGGVDMQLYTFFNLGSKWGVWSTPRFGCFTPGKDAIHILGPRAGLEGWEKSPPIGKTPLKQFFLWGSVFLFIERYLAKKWNIKKDGFLFEIFRSIVFHPSRNT